MATPIVVVLGVIIDPAVSIYDSTLEAAYSRIGHVQTGIYNAYSGPDISLGNGSGKVLVVELCHT